MEDYGQRLYQVERGVRAIKSDNSSNQMEDSWDKKIIMDQLELLEARVDVFEEELLTTSMG